MIDIKDIEKQVQEALTKKIETELSTYNLYDVIEQQINRTVEDKINATVTGLLNKLISNETVSTQVNNRLGADIQEKLDLAVRARVASIVTQTDLGTEISRRITQFVEERMLRSDLPRSFIPAGSIDWTNYKLPTECVGTGIEDLAADVNLTVLDGEVVVENRTVTKHLTVVENADIKRLSVDQLTIERDIVIKSGKFVEEIQSLIDGRIEKFHNRPVDLRGAALTSNQNMLIDNKSLGKSIVESNLRKVGRLTDLTVTGETTLAETVYIDHGRVGVNTEEPAGVLTLWDEESELTVRKYKNRTMFIGSTRDSELAIGVGGTVVLAVRRDGVEANRVKIGNINITSSDREPAHRGSPGDLVINTAAGAAAPWAWRCAGAETWIPLT